MYTLPKLPFDKNALAPFITAEGFDYHHGKHHQAYVNNLNALIEGTTWEEKSLIELIKKSYEQREIAIYNNAAQHYNHSFFWNCIAPQGKGTPSEDLAKLIDVQFGSFENFKNQFTETAQKLFGSGWVWLVKNAEGKLEIMPLKDADTPWIWNKKPILTLDVWEHAYYIDHRNARPQFIAKFWEHINWEFANLNLK